MNKRTWNLEEEDLPPSLKKRASSLFSISTAVEDDTGLLEERRISVDAADDGMKRSAPYARGTPATGAVRPPSTSTEESSEDVGLCIDEDETISALAEANVAAVGVCVSGTLGAAKATNMPVMECLNTGLVHEASSGHYDKSNPYHKEKPSRVLSVMDALENGQDWILERCRSLGSTASDDAVKFLDDEDYMRVHLPGYMQRLDKLCNCSCKELEREASQFASIYLTDQSTKEAKRAASSLCTLVSKVVDGGLDNGFAVIRPPGHHAEPGSAGGYCLINNVAVAAAYARAKLGVQKVLIVDWDIHHGNGTQSAFLQDPNVLYFSVHRWHGGNFFPFLDNGGPATVGIGDGEGFNVNVGWSRKGVGDEEYYAIWERLLLPMALEFEPDLVLVSSGFDGAAGDMGDCDISSECFAMLTGALMSLANGRVVCALEGGYVRSVLQACVKAVVGALLDPRSPQRYRDCEEEARKEREGRDILNDIEASAAKCIRATMKAHRPYWRCLQQEDENTT